MTDIVTIARRNGVIAFPILVGLFCGYYLIFQFHWSESFALLRRANWRLFLIGGVTTILIVWLCRAIRFYTLASAHGAPIEFRDAYLYTALSLALNAVLAFQLGEVVKMKALGDRSHLSASKLAQLFVAERIMDLLVLMILTLITLNTIVLGNDFTSWLLVIGYLCAALYLGLCFWPAMNGPTLNILFAGAKAPRERLILLLSTVVSWVATAWLWQIAFASVAIEVSLPQSTSIVGAATFATVLSAIPGGLGVSEVSISFLLTQASVPSDYAHAGALIIRITSILILGLGALHLLLWAWRSRKANSSPDIS